MRKGGRMKKLSIIVCAYNEEATVASVVEACCSCNPNAEVIVVDDGSKDRTPSILNELLEKFSFRYERMDKNRGKSWAMTHGVEIATGEIILFFDADLSNVSQEHFNKIINPIYNQEADMVLGQPSETLIDYRVNPFRSLTGERAVYKKDLLPILDDIREIRFGVETFINMYYQSKGKRIKYVLMDGLKHPTKYAKTTPINATKEFISEGQEIALTLMDNQDLIVQRIELKMKKTSKKAMDSLNNLQENINLKIEEIKKRFVA